MADKIKAIETWTGCPLSPEYLELLNKIGGKFIGDSILIYGSDEVIERNETFESKEYCPGFLAIGDDSGDQVFVIALGKNSSPVFVVDLGSMDPGDFVEVSPSIERWVRDNDNQWPPANCPPLVWPTLTNQAERLAWYRSVIEVYSLLWEDHVTQPKLAPISEKDLSELEVRLGCSLPTALRSYHSELGALSLAERLCSVTNSDTPIQPLLDAYPGITDIAENEAEIALANDLVAFGDYLGNGNMFCFHKQTGEVYFFDHDTDAMLTPFFSSTEEYLDALMIRCLSEIHENDDAGEAVLVERFGNALVKKWLY